MARRTSRRDFLELSARGCAAAAVFSALGLSPSDLFAGDSLEKILARAPKARFWEKVGNGSGAVACRLCSHNCIIEKGKRGICRTRINVGGELRSLVYGRPMTSNVDPIEKKPFYHFLPGSRAYSMATSGCPLKCKFCQNWEISQADPEDYSAPFTPPSDVAGAALANKAPVVAFTYNEPTVFAEYFLDIAREGKKSGLRSVIISCGFMETGPLKEMIETLDAIKFDLKGFSEDFYRNVSSARLQPVLRNIRQVAKAGRHLEIVNLVVPTLNDDGGQLKELAKFVLDETGPDTPLHFTRFHPDYKLLNLPPTPVSTLERARDKAMGIGLRYVYVGNVPGHAGNSTYCPKCGKAVIERKGFLLDAVKLKDGKCAACGEAIKGVWK